MNKKQLFSNTELCLSSFKILLSRRCFSTTPENEKSARCQSLRPAPLEYQPLRRGSLRSKWEASTSARRRTSHRAPVGTRQHNPRQPRVAPEPLRWPSTTEELDAIQLFTVKWLKWSILGWVYFTSNKNYIERIEQAVGSLQKDLERKTNVVRILPNLALFR